MLNVGDRQMQIEIENCPNDDARSAESSFRLVTEYLARLKKDVDQLPENVRNATLAVIMRKIKQALITVEPTVNAIVFDYKLHTVRNRKELTEAIDYANKVLAPAEL